MTLTREALDRMGCGMPGCDCDGPLHLNPRCHPGKGVDVIYHNGGRLEINCQVCDRPVCEIMLAATPLAVLRQHPRRLRD